MSSKRAVRRKACTGKRRHPDRATATAAAPRRNGHKLLAYRCRFCSGWHVGRPSRRLIQSFRDRHTARSTSA